MEKNSIIQAPQSDSEGIAMDSMPAYIIELEKHL